MIFNLIKISVILSTLETKTATDNQRKKKYMDQHSDTNFFFSVITLTPNHRVASYQDCSQCAFYRLYHCSQMITNKAKNCILLQLGHSILKKCKKKKNPKTPNTFYLIFTLHICQELAQTLHTIVSKCKESCLMEPYIQATLTIWGI